MKVQQVSPGIINKIKSLIARVGYLKSDIGIVEDTDTATHTISSGQYVIWKNELYKASAAIPSGDPLSSTNLTAVSDGIANELNGNFAKIEGSTVSFWTTLSTQKYQGNYFAQVYGNFKGKTLTLTGAIVYNGTSSYNILSTTSITQLNDFCVNISTTSDSVGGTPFYVTFSVS